MEQCGMWVQRNEGVNWKVETLTASVSHRGQLAGGRDKLSNGSSKTKCSTQDHVHTTTINILGMFHSRICSHFLTHT